MIATQLLQRHAQAQGEPIHVETLTRILKANGLVRKRTRHSLKKERCRRLCQVQPRALEAEGPGARLSWPTSTRRALRKSTHQPQRLDAARRAAPLQGSARQPPERDGGAAEQRDCRIRALLVQQYRQALPGLRVRPGPEGQQAAGDRPRQRLHSPCWRDPGRAPDIEAARGLKFGSARTLVHAVEDVFEHFGSQFKMDF